MLLPHPVLSHVPSKSPKSSMDTSTHPLLGSIKPCSLEWHGIPCTRFGSRSKGIPTAYGLIHIKYDEPEERLLIQIYGILNTCYFSGFDSI